MAANWQPEWGWHCRAALILFCPYCCLLTLFKSRALEDSWGQGSAGLRPCPGQ